MSCLLGFFDDARDALSWARFSSEVLAPLLIALVVLASMARRIYRLTKAGLHFNRVHSVPVAYKRSFLAAWSLALLAEVAYCAADEPRIPYNEKHLVVFPEYAALTRA